MAMELEPIAPEDAVELYLTDKQMELADATLRSRRSRSGHFLQWCENEDVINLNNLTGRDLHCYRLWRQKESDIAPVTEKAQMNTLRVFIRWCASVNGIHTALFTKPISPSLDNGENVRDVEVDSEAAEQVLEYLNTYDFVVVLSLHSM